MTFGLIDLVLGVMFDVSLQVVGQAFDVYGFYYGGVSTVKPLVISLIMNHFENDLH